MRTNEILAAKMGMQPEELAKAVTEHGVSGWINEALCTGKMPTIADGTQMISIVQRIGDEDFEWWLHILHDGQVQALWREAISGAINHTMPQHADYYDSDMHGLGVLAASLRKELILTVEDVEYRVEYTTDASFVSWLDAASGAEQKARITSEWYSPGSMSLEEILSAVRSPEARVA